MTSFVQDSGVRSWGNVLKPTHLVAHPAWRDDLPSLVASARDGKHQLLASGLRRSYGDSALNPGGVLVDMTELDRFIDLSPETRTVRAEAGLSLDVLISVLLAKKLFVPVTPGTRFVTLGGAVANDVHGKNHHQNGTIGRWIRKLGLLRSDGIELELSPEDPTGLFAATIGGLGLTGIITWIELEVIPVDSIYIDSEKIPFGNLGEFFALAEESERDFEYTVAWVDCQTGGAALGRGLFSRGRHAVGGPGKPVKSNVAFTMPVNLPSIVMNRTTLRAFNEIYYRNGRRTAGGARESLYPFFYPLDSIGHWNRMYGASGMYQYQMVVPYNVQEDATRAALNAVTASGQGSFLAVLKTFGDVPSPGILSFPEPGTTLALDFPNRGSDTLRLMERLDAIVLEAGGRLYPAKDGRMPARVFQAGYPDWQSFAKHIDRAYSSHFWERVSKV